MIFRLRRHFVCATCCYDVLAMHCFEAAADVAAVPLHQHQLIPCASGWYQVLCYCCLLVLLTQVRWPGTCTAAKLMQMTAGAHS
jgi:hypothetical protein